MIWRRDLRWAPFWWACALSLVAVVLWGCLAPAKDIPRIAGLVNDKLEHSGAFFAMTLCFGAIARRTWYPLAAVALCGLGGLIEILQYLMALGRDADWFDFLADSVGVTAAVILLYAGLGEWMRWVEEWLSPR